MTGRLPIIGKAVYMILYRLDDTSRAKFRQRQVVELLLGILGKNSEEMSSGFAKMEMTKVHYT